MTDRTLDAQLAERLFGYEWYLGYRGRRGLLNPIEQPVKGRHWLKAKGNEPLMEDPYYIVPKFTADWNGAGRVIEKMREKGLYLIVGEKIGGEVEFVVTFTGKEAQGEAFHESFPIAVALAALSALTENDKQ